MLDISEVSKRAGMPASTVRYYEEKGLISSVGRKGLKRVFDADIIERLSLIALGQRAGFKLEELKEMFGSGRRINIDRDRLVEKADDLDQMISQLSAVRDGLRHASQCSAPSHMECPKFQQLMRLAIRKKGRGL